MIDKKIKEFQIWYKNELPHHEEAISFFSNLIIEIPKVESVSSRVKTLDECINKFKRKYLSSLEQENKEYKINNYITDLIGIRAICLYSEDVYKIRQKLKKYFQEVEITDKSGQLEKTDDKFGYKGVHLQLALKNRLKGIPDQAKFKKITFELQIHTIIQDAWSILDHKIKYKKSIPQNLKRRINRLSALFEIADDEFLSIQKEISLEELKINKRLQRGGKIERTKALDVFRFLFISLKYFPDYYFVESKIDGFVQEILTLNSNFTEGELNEALKLHLSFVNKIEIKIKQNLNPYTKIRYCLYKFDFKNFESLLSKHQQGIINSYT